MLKCFIFFFPHFFVEHPKSDWNRIMEVLVEAGKYKKQSNMWPWVVHFFPY